jgi:hypothetical protein
MGKTKSRKANLQQKEEKKCQNGEASNTSGWMPTIFDIQNVSGYMMATVLAKTYLNLMGRH